MFGFFKKHNRNTPIKKDKPVENFTDIDMFIDFFRESTGIDFTKKKQIAENKLILFCRNHEIYDFKECIRQTEQDPDLKQELIDTFAVNETYFFRERKQIEEMIERAKTKSQKVEILCAPSSSGEEPYSIAILLLEAGFDINKFQIVGIDISDKAIKKANEAIYSKRSLHRASHELVGKYFIQDEDHYVLKDFVKAKVSFRRVNIFDDTFNNLRKFDYIFSRNMMIYFDKETKQKAKDILQKLLKDPSEPILFGHADMID